MFRHKPNKKSETGADKNKAEAILERKPKEAEDQDAVLAEAKEKISLPEPEIDFKPEPDLRELIEKNLKWSQIIYEQNRKINRKLAWAAVASWLRTVLILTPIALAIWFLPPYINQFNALIKNFTGATSASGGKPSYSVEQILQLLPLGDAEKQQLKAILK